MNDMANDVLTGTDDFDSIFSASDEGSTAAEAGAAEAAQQPEETEQTEEQQAEQTPQQADEGEKADKAEAQQPEQKPSDGEQFILKYYGQEIPKSRDEVTQLAQKGMDYDNVRSKWESAAPVVGFIEKIAAAQGMTPQQYVEFAQKQIEQQQVNELVDSDVPQDVAAELLQLRKERAARQQQEQAQAKQAERAKQFEELLKAYPEITKNPQLPAEVVQAIAQGETPLSAYRAYENARLKSALAAQKADIKNKQTAPGSVAGVGDKETADAFEKAFDRGFGI